MHDAITDIELKEQLLEDSDQSSTQIKDLRARFDAFRDGGYRWALHLLRRILNARKRNQQAAVPRLLHATAWLDGLRGFAALMVFIGHHEDWGHDEPVIGMLVKPSGYEGQYYFTTTPVIRLIFSAGGFAVYLFFVISGFAVSYKSVKLVQARDYVALTKTLSSAIFRRWLRLHLPVGVIMFLWMTSWHVFGIHSIRAPTDVQATWFREIAVWWKDFQSEGLKYSSHIWTIPVEFRGSMMIWATVLATSHLTTIARLCSHTILLFWLLFQSQTNALFLAGLMIADTTLLAQADQLPRILQRMTPRWNWMWHFPFVLGLCMASFGQIGDSNRPVAFTDTVTDPMHFLSWLVPPGHTQQYNFWFSFWGAVLITASIPSIPWMMKCLESRVGQFLGRLSFMLYLVHGPILWSIGARMFKMAGLKRYNDLDWWLDRWPLPEAGPFGLEVRWLIPTILDLAISLLVAHVFTRCIDDLSIKFGHWLYQTGRRKEEVSLDRQS